MLERALGAELGHHLVQDIRAFLLEMYAVEVSPDLISTVTDAVQQEVTAWQARPLEPMYPVVLFDALRVRMRDEAVVQSKAVYLALAIQPDGRYRADRRGGRGRAHGGGGRPVGPPISHRHGGLAPRVGPGHSVLRVSAGHPADDLHHQCLGKREPADPEGAENARHFPTDEAAIKLIWLVWRNLTARWHRSEPHWRAAMNQIAILYGDRFEHPQV